MPPTWRPLRRQRTAAAPPGKTAEVSAGGVVHRPPFGPLTTPCPGRAGARQRGRLAAGGRPLRACRRGRIGRLLLGDSASDELLGTAEIRTPAFRRSARARGIARPWRRPRCRSGGVVRVLPRDCGSRVRKLAGRRLRSGCLCRAPDQSERCSSSPSVPLHKTGEGNVGRARLSGPVRLFPSRPTA
jgi:hypothetical protein